MPFSGNCLKIIAAIAMAVDHFGLLCFPNLLIFRIIGRISFPIFAYFIAEGCKYTRNRLRYWGIIAGMGLVFQLGYYILLGGLYMSIFITFSFSIALIYLLDECKKAFLSKERKTGKKIGLVCAFFAALAAVWFIANIQYKDFAIDYTFWGIITPLFASAFHAPKDAPERWKGLDIPQLGVAAMALPLLPLALTSIMPCQFYSFLALPLLLLYSGKRGKYKMKYFFYIYYPAHLAVIFVIYCILYLL